MLQQRLRAISRLASRPVPHIRVHDPIVLRMRPPRLRQDGARFLKPPVPAQRPIRRKALLRRFFGRRLVIAQKRLHADAEDFGQRQKQRDVGIGVFCFPLAHRRAGDAQKLCQPLLRVSLGQTQPFDVRSDVQFHNVSLTIT